MITVNGTYVLCFLLIVSWNMSFKRLEFFFSIQGWHQPKSTQSKYKAKNMAIIDHYNDEMRHMYPLQSTPTFFFFFVDVLHHIIHT